VLSLVAVALACACTPVPAQNLGPTPERKARHVQRDFEMLRRALLPRVPARGDGCDVTIGDICYWDDNADSPLPAERPRVALARRQLRSSLDSLGAIDSASDYIAGQRVRYAVEAGDAAGAARALAHCAATPWWCAALRAFAWHRAGDEAASSAAFDTALAEMPDTLRCQWLDVHDWLPQGTNLEAARDRRSCDARAATSERVFWLAAPLLTWRPDAALDEFCSRRKLPKMLEGTANAQYSFWRWDSEKTALRYGWPDQWAREDTPIDPAAFPDPRIIGDEPRPSFSLVPDPHALESPFAANPGDWRLTEDRAAIMRYAPGWLRMIDTLPVQIARFRRPGDSMVVVAVYDAGVLLDSGSTAFVAAASLSSGLAPESTLAIGRTQGAPTGDIVLDAPARAALAAVEVFDSVGHRAARWRAGLAPLPASAAISDLLVGRAGAAFAPATPDSAARVAMPALRVTARDTLALYWESYLRPPPGVPIRTTVRLTKAAGFFGRLGHAFGLGRSQAGPAVSWEDAQSDATVAHSLRFGVADLPPGHYRIEVTVQTPGAHGTAFRDVDVVE